MSSPTQVHLSWQGGERFSGSSGEVPVVVDGEGTDVLSPMQALAVGVAGCMSIDVASILEKGRQPLEALEIELTGLRAPEPPRRFVEIAIHYRIRGAVAPEKVERAIALSRDRYCSAWQSMRADIELRTTFEIESTG